MHGRPLEVTMWSLLVLCGSGWAADDEEPRVTVDHRHGFRLGYAYYPDQQVLDEPHLFVMGYELSQRLDGGSIIDVLIVQNLLVSGLNQSLFAPSANLLVGASIHDTLEIGVGPNLSLMPDVSTNMIAGVGVMIFVQMFINMAMVAGLVPVVGVPLPFVSYGGTAMLTLFIGIGILMSVHSHRRLVQT